MKFSTKISKNCLERLYSYANDKELEYTEANNKIVSYCSALYDVGILNMRERAETSTFFRNILNKRHEPPQYTLIAKHNGYLIYQYSEKLCQTWGLVYPTYAAFMASVEEINPSFEECSMEILENLKEWCDRN